MSKLYLYACLFIFLFVIPVHAQNEEIASSLSANDVQKELADVKYEIEKEQGRIALIESKEQELNQELNNADDELKRLSSEKGSAEKGREKADVRIAMVQKVISHVEAQAKELRDAAFDRIVVSYKMHRKLHLFDYLFGANSVLDVYQRGRFLEVIVRKDRERLAGFSALMARLTSERKQYQDAQAEKLAKLNDIKNLSDQFEKKRYTYGILLSTLKENKEQRQQTIERLVVSAKRLQKVLEDIMEEQSGEGMGLEVLYGKLPSPVDGKVVRRFGVQRHDEFSEMLYVKGLEFITPVGYKVKALATGSVIFSQVLPEYGNVIIIDHGKRYYTLYGRLASSLVSVGGKVAQGDVIAVLGEPDNKGANFYFELRVKGKAVDPWNYFATPPKS